MAGRDNGTAAAGRRWLDAGIDRLRATSWKGDPGKTGRQERAVNAVLQHSFFRPSADKINLSAPRVSW